MPMEFAKNFGRFFKRESKPQLEDQSQRLISDSSEKLLPEHAQATKSEMHSVQPVMSQQDRYTARQEADMASEAELRRQVEDILNHLLAEENKSETQEAAPLVTQSESKDKALQEVSAIQKESKSGSELAAQEALPIAKWLQDETEKHMQLEEAAEKEFQRAKEEARGLLVSEGYDTERELLQKMNENEKKLMFTGKEVVASIKEHMDSLEPEILSELTQKASDSVDAEQALWSSALELRDRTIQRFPEQADVVRKQFDALTEEAENKKKSIAPPEEWPTLNTPEDEKSKQESEFSWQKIAAKFSEVRGEAEAELKELFEVEDDGKLSENSLLMQGISIEAYKKELDGLMPDFLKKAELDASLADRLLMVSQLKYQLQTQLDLMRTLIDATVQEVVQSVKDLPNQVRPDLTAPAAIQTENIEEEEEENPSNSQLIQTPAELQDPAVSAVEQAPSASLATEVDPMVADAQEELRRLEQRKKELQQILEKQWQVNTPTETGANQAGGM